MVTMKNLFTMQLLKQLVNGTYKFYMKAASTCLYAHAMSHARPPPPPAGLECPSTSLREQVVGPVTLYVMLSSITNFCLTPKTHLLLRQLSCEQSFTYTEQ